MVDKGLQLRHQVFPGLTDPPCSTAESWLGIRHTYKGGKGCLYKHVSSIGAAILHDKS